jgi:DNA mismatch endonuclease, patch repair protein
VADIVSTQRRSQMMASIRRENTKPELVVRSALHAMGYRFRLHVKGLPGTPDIVLPKYATVLRIQGCFWHRHEGCRLAYTPKTRREFWSAKFAENTARDDLQEHALGDLGWRVIDVWECEVRGNDNLPELVKGRMADGTNVNDTDRSDHDGA